MNVLICGKPGTSKTLTVQILNKILDPKLNRLGDFSLLKYFKLSEFEYIFGSTSTTSKSVQQKMDFTQSKYLDLPEDNSTVSTLIFDEIGLAENSPDNPLKVLHSYLDPASEDKSPYLLKMVENRLATEERFESLSEQDKKSLVARVQN